MKKVGISLIAVLLTCEGICASSEGEITISQEIQEVYETHEIVNDYEASNVVYAASRDKLYAELVNNGLSPEETSMLANMAAVDRDAMAAAMDKIDEEFDGMEAYLHDQIGLTDEEISILRDKYL